MLRTQEQIANYIQKNRDSHEDVFGFMAEVLIGYLDFAHAKPFLKPEAKPEDWKTDPLTREHVIETMRDYMSFAWQKCEDHRGISAGRSVQKMQAWCWVLGEDHLIDWEEFAQYGAPILLAVSQRYGFEIPTSDAVARMALGEYCRPDCEEGCGH